ncbi:hypothetical protein B0H14DRAFT_2601881 [Mycena olivaceomarginata]|nr:hypothetical protein B0H14DRAFT_2601881 [Mycena olivaceomarginata]
MSIGMGLLDFPGRFNCLRNITGGNIHRLRGFMAPLTSFLVRKFHSRDLTGFGTERPNEQTRTSWTVSPRTDFPEAGLNIDFKGGKGLSVHLKLTTHPPCRAIFLAAEAGNVPSAFPAPQMSMEDQNESFGDLSGPGLPQGHTTFQGDFFGEDYTPEELGYDPDDDAGDPPQSDDEEDDPRAREREDASRAGLEHAADATLPPPTQEARQAAEDRFHRKPIVVHYPSDVAGQPLRSGRSKTTEQAYKSCMAVMQFLV